MREGPHETAAVAFFTVGRPIVVRVSSLAATQAFATVFAPVVVLIPSLAANRALAACPFVKTEHACHFHTRFS
jgi:hypothetical protein